MAARGTMECSDFVARGCDIRFNLVRGDRPCNPVLNADDQLLEAFIPGGIILKAVLAPSAIQLNFADG